MPAKLKPSSKKYVRDSKGKMTKNWTWEHYTPSMTSTENLKKLLGDSSYRKKRNIIERELAKRA
jgi:hypothetical protein